MKRRAFTVLELLAAIAIVLTLAVIAFPYFTGMCSQARAVREMNGAKRAVSAWLNHAAENNGQILEGYKSDPSARNGRGQPLAFPTNARYPYRLAPYLNYELRGSLLVNNQAALTSDYEISVAPSFGINLTFVGGDHGSGSDLRPTQENLDRHGQFVVTRLPQIHAPARLIVFASARFEDPGSGKKEGYNAIKSPFFAARRWPSTYDENQPYYDFGNVHLRFKNRAVCAMADGHVEMLDYDQLLDMTRWSNQAAADNNPDWTISL